MGDSAAISNFNIKGRSNFNLIFCALKNFFFSLSLFNSGYEWAHDSFAS